MPKQSNIVGKAIKKLRKKRMLTQGEIAGLLGLHQSAVSRIESGAQELTISETLKLAAHFDMDPASIAFPKWRK